MKTIPTTYMDKASDSINQLRKSLQECEFRNEQLIESLPVAIYTTDANGYITSYNIAAALLWGREPEIGKDLWCGSWKIYRPDGSPLPLDSCPMAIALREKRSVYGEQIVIERPDGQRLLVSPYPNPIFDTEGQLTGAINMLISFTEIAGAEPSKVHIDDQLRLLTAVFEKKIEQRTAEVKRKNTELKDSEERYHKMIEEVEDYAILLLDRYGIVQNWNKGAEKIKRYKESEIVGRHFRVFYQPEDQEKGLPEMLMGHARQTGKAMHEGWRVRKDGSKFWGSIVITALHDNEGEIIGYSKVTRDLTERKNAEDKLKQYAKELEMQNRELQQFAYAAAHDMKEPLRKVIFYTTSVLESAENDIEDREKEYLRRAADASSRMQKLIEDLLTYTKSSAGDNLFEPVNLDEILDDVKTLHQEQIENLNVTIIASPLPVISGIAFQIRQLFDNLLGNALKYSAPGRTAVIRITCEKIDAGAVDGIDLPAASGYYKLSFTDNGIGFPQEYAEKIFELFERLHSRADHPGTGIGLALCKRIVQNHKGAIKATGVPDRGATFVIFLPVPAIP